MNDFINLSVIWLIWYSIGFAGNIIAFKGIQLEMESRGISGRAWNSFVAIGLSLLGPIAFAAGLLSYAISSRSFGKNNR